MLFIVQIEEMLAQAPADPEGNISIPDFVTKLMSAP
jgi:hypothetical protein